MRNIFLYARETDIDASGRRFKLGVAELKGLDLIHSNRTERSYLSLNDLCSALEMAAEAPIDRELEKLRRELPSNFDFVMMVTESEAKRLGFQIR